MTKGIFSNRLLPLVGILATLLLTVSITGAGQSVLVDPILLQQLQKTVLQQQVQLELQKEQLRLQSQRLDDLKQLVKILRQPDLPPDIPAQKLPATTITTAPQPVAPPANDRIKLVISGQINRAVNIISDGGNSGIYHVDNDASNSRVRFVGSAQITDNLFLGTRLEVAFSPNNSSLVSQTNQSSGDYFNPRWVEISLESKKLGKLSLGKGNSASKETANQDLSRTDLVQYAGIAAIAGGMLFRNAGNNHDLTSIRVSNAFNNKDGLGRQSRLRYDSPELMGFTLAGSLVSNQRSDLALFWAGTGYGFQAVGAAAVANPREAGSGLQYDGSFSLLHSDSGLNLTVSGGILKRTAELDSSNLYAKLGWIANMTSLGTTAFGLDYTSSANTPSSNDRGYSIGGAIVQSFERYATELYLQHRIYSLKQGRGEPLDDIQVSTMGMRVKF